MTICEERPALLEPVDEIELPGAYLSLRAGAEFTAQGAAGARKRRLRLSYARLTPKGWEVTGWDGKGTHTYRADQIIEVHLDRQVEQGGSRPPAARRTAR